MKNIKKALAENADKILPDDGVKQNIKTRLGYDDRPQKLAYAHGGTTTLKKNGIITFAAIALAIVICLATVLPLTLGKRGGITNKFTGIVDADSFYAYGAASIGSILAYGKDSQSAKALPKASTENAKRTASVDTADLDPYITLIETLLAEDKIINQSIGGTDRYEFGMTVKCIDLSGGSASYSMYYNKIFLSDETDGDEYESNYSITGVLYAGDGIYPVEGTYETQTEKDESECELYFKAFTTADRSSYIEVTRESETEKDEQEYEYVYSVYENDRLLEKTEIKYEYEGGKTEIELKMEKGDNTQTIEFEKEIYDGKTILTGKGNINGTDVKFRIYQTDGDRKYVFYD